MRTIFWAGVMLGAAACALGANGGGDGGSSDDAGSTTDVSFGDSTPPTSCDVVHCSADLHQIIDCNGTVLQTCPPTAACGTGGVCVSPCEGAADNQSAIGCDFFAPTPAPDATAADSCYAVLLANTWNAPVDVKVEWNGAALSTTSLARVVAPSGLLGPLTNGQLGAGEVGAFFLSAKDSNRAFWTACPITPGVSSTYTSVDGTGVGKAFHVTTSAPVVAYDVYPYGGATSYITSASLLLPTPAWGTNYIGADGYAYTAGAGMPYLQLVAAEDDTHVTILPSQTIIGGPGVAAATKGQSQTYTMAKGDVLQVQQNAELAGSPISSDKAITVFGGASCADIPVQSGYCDSLHQQLPSVSMLGSEYLAVRYRNRGAKEENVPWRFVGAVDGTTLTFDPPQTGAPTQIDAGQLVEFWSKDAFRVASQDDKHPFYMSSHMTGCTSSLTPNYDGDPDFVNVVPPQRWLPSYLFVADPTYGNTNLVFVRGKATDGTFKDVTLDCAGTLSGWTPIGAGAFEYTRVDLVIGKTPQNKCTNGVRTAKSDAPFALTVWGFDDSVSYAYPAGMGTFPINSVVVSTNPK